MIPFYIRAKTVTVPSVISDISILPIASLVSEVSPTADIPVDKLRRKNLFVQPNTLIEPTGDVPRQRTTATASTETPPVDPVTSVGVLCVVRVVKGYINPNWTMVV